MKPISTLLCIAALASLATGCVRRTVMQQAENRGAQTGQKFGASPYDKEISSEIIWFWQKEFRNPQ